MKVNIQSSMTGISLLLLYVFLFTECKTASYETLWVGGVKSNCSNDTSNDCLFIQKGNELQSGEWTSFYDEIKGFDFEAGILKKIKVRKKNQSSENGSIVAYTYIETLDQQEDPRSQLDDKWLLQSIRGRSVEDTPLKEAHLSITIQKSMVSGSNGCNSLNGNIEELGLENIRFGDFVSSRKMCPEMEQFDHFNNTLPIVERYAVKKNRLELSDADGKSLMIFYKN